MRETGRTCCPSPGPENALFIMLYPFNSSVNIKALFLFVQYPERVPGLAAQGKSFLDYVRISESSMSACEWHSSCLISERLLVSFSRAIKFKRSNTDSSYRR